MSLIFEWDVNKAQSNLDKHGISFEETATVFADENALTINDPSHSINEKRYVTLGSSHKGKILVVVHTDRGERIRIISGRPASKKERQQYQQQ
jgi:uncharacterized DUF497 family protein